jgi:hypothetical protein
VKNGASLNIQTNGIPFERLNAPSIERAVLHEFGHALGLLHEHQSPAAKCADEFDWPKIFSYAEKNWGWDSEKVRTNFAPYVSDPRLRTTSYDKASIMHYALAEWMFKKGKNSRCYIAEPKTISATDRVAIINAYPAAVAQQDQELRRRAALVGTILARLNLDTSQLALIGAKLATNMKHFDRKLTLQFALADDGIVRRSGEQWLNPCEGQKLMISTAPLVTCGVAPDGSGFKIEINPVAAD